jgi:hypothetical protein
MNQRELASVLFAVVGAFIAISRLPELIIFIGMVVDAPPETPSPADGMTQRSIATFGSIGAATGILAGTVLVGLRDRLATRLFATGTQSITVREVQAVALSVLGCYFAVQGISRFGWTRNFDWTAAIQLGLGAALFFGASSLSGLWALSRTIGQSRAPTERIQTGEI